MSMRGSRNPVLWMPPSLGKVCDLTERSRREGPGRILKLAGNWIFDHRENGRMVEAVDLFDRPGPLVVAIVVEPGARTNRDEVRTAHALPCVRALNAMVGVEWDHGVEPASRGREQDAVELVDGDERPPRTKNGIRV